MHLLGIVAARAGQHKIAAELMGNSVALAPHVVSYRSNLATALIELGALAEAEQTLNEALGMMPEAADLHVKLGTVSVANGDVQAGITQFRAALRINPHEPMAHFNLAETYRRQGDVDAAAKHLQAAIQANPQFAEAYNNLSGILLDKGDFLAGLHCLQRLLQLQPRSAQAYTNLGLALRVAGDTQQALICYGNAVTLDPQAPLPWYDMATLHVTSGDLVKALECIDQLQRVAPEDPRVVIGRARILERQGELTAALELIEPVYAQDPLHPAGATTYAVIQEQLGARQKAASAVQAVCDADDIAASETIHARFCLGQINDAMGRYEEAWESYQNGNSNRKQAQIYPFDPDVMERQISQLLEWFAADRFQHYPRASLEDEMPIFIVGMPRSGTTLAEQIISSHRDVHGAGELTEISALVRSTWGDGEQASEAANTPFRIVDGDGSSNGLIPDLQQVTTDQLNGLAERYLEKLRSVAGDASRVTDKMPYNFMHIPFIRMLFPKVPIIHCRRHPLDTTLSCYFQNFSAGNEYAFDLEHLGIFYRLYQRVMDRWCETVQYPIFDLQYEDLVLDPETHTRRMLEYCGLTWDDDCMKFQQSKRMVLTASYQQVRKPIYTKSVNRWQHYRDHLSPLIQQLGTGGES